jgi:cold-inducible RNA-binding protein
MQADRLLTIPEGCMAKKLYVGNISWTTTETELQTKFSEFGSVEEVIIIRDKISGRSKGFGFVTFANDEEADAAISTLNGESYNGRPLTVNEARPQQSRT